MLPDTFSPSNPGANFVISGGAQATAEEIVFGGGRLGIEAFDNSLSACTNCRQYLGWIRIPHIANGARYRYEDRLDNWPSISLFGPLTNPIARIVDCDFNGDGSCDIGDIDPLITEIAAGTNDPTFDLNANGLVNVGDRDLWLQAAGAMHLPSGNPYLVADCDLDSFVDGEDFAVWNDNRFSSTARWSLADFNADGVTDGRDFIEWNNNRFMSADGISMVPEPGLGVPLFFVVMFLGVARQR